MMHHGDLFMQQVMPQLLVVLNTFLSQADPLCAKRGDAVTSTAEQTQSNLGDAVEDTGLAKIARRPQ